MIINVHVFAGWWEPGMGVHYTWANTSDLMNTGSNIKIIYTRLNFTTIRSPRTFFKKKWKVQNYIQWSAQKVVLCAFMEYFSRVVIYFACDMIRVSSARGMWRMPFIVYQNLNFYSLFQAFSSVRKTTLFYFFARCFRRCALTNGKPGRD